MAGLGALRTTFPTLFAEPLYTASPGNPASQTGMEVFNSPTSAGVSPAGPALGIMTRTAGPDRAVLLTGDAWNSATYLDFWSPSGALSDSGQANWLTSGVFALTTNKAAWGVPGNMPRHTGILVTPRNATQNGRPKILNKTEALFLADIGSDADRSTGSGGRFCVASNTVAVYGFNMTKPIRSTTSRTFDGATTSLTFTVPAGLNISGSQQAYIEPDDDLITQGNSISGTITYSGTTVTLTVDTARTIGAGTFASWRIYTTSYTWIRLSTGTRHQFVTPTYADPYQVRFTMPASITDDGGGTPGTTTLAVNDIVSVYVTSSMGGNKFGWSRCYQTISVQTLASLAINYTASQTLSPSGDTDGSTDSDNIAAAITALSSTAGKIRLHTGTYYFDESIFLVAGGGAGVSLEAFGDGAVTLRAGTGFAGTSFVNAGTESQLKNLTINLTTNASSLVQQNGALLCNRLFNVVITTTGFTTAINPQGALRAIVTGSTINSFIPFYNATMNRCYIDTTIFHQTGSGNAGTDASWAEAGINTLYSWNGGGVVVTRCVFTEDHAGACRGRPINLVGQGENLYWGHNLSTLSPIDGNNAGENILFHQVGTLYAPSTVVSSDNSGATTVVTMASGAAIPDPASQSNFVFLTAGKGQGQHARILSRNVGAATMTLDALLDIPPDSSTTIKWGEGVRRIIIHDSRHTGLAGLTFSASCLVNCYNAVCDMVVDNCLANSFNYSFQLLPGAADPTRGFPQMNILIKDSSFASCGQFTRMNTATGGAPFYVLYRNLKSTGNTVLDLEVNHNSTDVVVHDGCRYEGANTGVDGTTGVQILWNTKIVSPTTFSGSYGVSAAAVSAGAVFHRFGTSAIGKAGTPTAGGEWFQNNNQA